MAYLYIFKLCEKMNRRVKQKKISSTILIRVYNIIKYAKKDWIRRKKTGQKFISPPVFIINHHHHHRSLIIIIIIIIKSGCKDDDFYLWCLWSLINCDCVVEERKKRFEKNCEDVLMSLWYGKPYQSFFSYYNRFLFFFLLSNEKEN